jgi:hypothetical protein
MVSSQPSFDAFLEEVLREAQPRFGYITEEYPPVLPAELFWTLCTALVLRKGLRTKAAAEVILDFCIRRGDEIPGLMNSRPPRVQAGDGPPLIH